MNPYPVMVLEQTAEGHAIPGMLIHLTMDGALGLCGIVAVDDRFVYTNIKRLVPRYSDELTREQEIQILKQELESTRAELERMRK